VLGCEGLAGAAFGSCQRVPGQPSCTATERGHRLEVAALVKEKASKREIRAWFAAEDGGKENPYLKGTSRTGIEDYENGCTHLDLLLAVLDRKAEPTTEMLAPDGLSEADVANGG
jgi:hypothetical protein